MKQTFKAWKDGKESQQNGWDSNPELRAQQAPESTTGGQVPDGQSDGDNEGESGATCRMGKKSNSSKFRKQPSWRFRIK